MGDMKTIRIPMLVDREGNYYASGTEETKDHEWLYGISDTVSDDSVQMWITVELDLAALFASHEVKGAVSDA